MSVIGMYYCDELIKCTYSYTYSLL